MSTQYIKISDLTPLQDIGVADFIPLVHSSSISYTTYRVSIARWNAFWDVYGSASFAHNAGSSLTAISSSHSITASYAISSSAAASASYVDGSNIVGTVESSSYAFTSSYAITASNSITSSHALTAEDSQRAVSASYALSSSHAQTSSYALIAEQVLQGAPVYGTVPVGSIVDFSGDTVSDPNWAICDGDEVDELLHPALATLLGTGGASKWGTATVGYVRLPDFRKRLTLGASGVLTNLSGSVGNYGGGEFYQNHFHFYGWVQQRRTDTDSHAPFNGNSWRNDDVYLPMMGAVELTTNESFPSRSFRPGNNTAFPYFWLRGHDSSGVYQPRGYFTPATDSGPNGWALGTSFPFNDSGSTEIGYTAESYNRQDDMAMPYGVVNKIIRIS